MTALLPESTIALASQPQVLRGRPEPDFLREECLGDLLADTAARRPDHPALLWGDRTVTYHQLHSLSSRLGVALVRHGAQPGRIVGLCMPRGADLLIGQAGITQSGAAWLPFDADTPRERIQVCLQAAGAVAIVTARETRDRLADVGVAVLAFEDLLEESPSSSLSVAPLPLPLPSDPAYVIYTSGSTGVPKGIVITHRSICHFLRSENAILGVHENDRVYQGFSVAFDMSFEEIWMSYLVGATLWIAPPTLVADPEELALTLARQKITVLHAVPTLMGLIDDPMRSVRLINLGGETCPDSLVAKLARPGRRLFNTYGPTETTVSATIAELTPDRPVDIGTPLPNYGVLVLDSSQQPLPPDQVGELCVFGPGLAVGYLGNSELTESRFINNPVAQSVDEARLYLTGDAARIDADGVIHCLGRIDSQIKIRGFRVEPGEIETALAALPGVAVAAVAMRSISGVDQLVGFVIASGPDAPDASVLRASLMSSLPVYMVPTHLQFVADLPRLVSGKLDRKALGALPVEMVQNKLADQSAQNPDEERLYAAVRQLCPGRALHPDADFFDDLGGHSLVAARLVSMIRSDPVYSMMGVRDLYRERKLGAIARVMTALRTGTTSASAQSATAKARVPVSNTRYLLCGTAQTIVLPLLVLLHIADWLIPFFTYHMLTGDDDDSIPLAALYAIGAYVAVQVAGFGVAIAGKWLVAGRLKPGRYPLWGLTYFRWWLADQLRELPPVHLLAGTPLMAWYLRAFGAKIGSDVFIDSLGVRVPELLTIESDANLGMGVHMENARVEAGELIIGTVHIGREAVVDSYTVLENDTVVEAGAHLGGLSALTAGRRIPQGEIWEGAPARKVERKIDPVPARPRISLWLHWLRGIYFAVAGLGISTLFFMPLFPSFMLIDWLDMNMWNLDETDVNSGIAFGVYFLLAIPASVFLVFVTVLLSAGLRRLLLSRQVAGVWSIYSLVYCRKWFVSQVLENSLDILHGLYASVFASAWLRLMGATVGAGAEVSTTTGIVPDLLIIGKDSFIADGALLGDEEQRGGWMILRPTTVGDRSFVGNGAYVPDGARIPDDVLIGVQTKTPDNADLASGQTWLGSPALRIPARETQAQFSESLTFRPSAVRRLGRAVIETLRIVLPIALVIAAGYLIVRIIVPMAEDEEWGMVALALGLAGFSFGLVSFLFVVVLKWILIGRYKPRSAPMWTPFVWVSEAVTNMYESLAVPNLLGFLRGTPLLPWALRMLGARIGKRVYLDTTDLTEFDCVSIGDEAELNGWSGPQTHLFEDRVMKIGLVDIGARATVGSLSTILYDTQIGQGVQLGPLTLVAKGERLPAQTRWEGSPASPSREG